VTLETHTGQGVEKGKVAPSLTERWKKTTAPPVLKPSGLTEDYVGKAIMALPCGCHQKEVK